MIVIHDLNNKLRYPEKELMEFELQSLIISNWDFLFHDYILITKEFQLNGDVRQVNRSGRIDILALNKQTKRFVIIELKREFDINIRSQAFDYYDYFIDNKHELYLKANEYKNLPSIKDLDINNVEIILIAKRFKDSDYRITNIDSSLILTLISYNYFANNQLILSINNRDDKIIKNRVVVKDINNELDKFWCIFNSLIESNNIRINEHFKLVNFIDEATIYINIPSIYEKYVVICKEQETTYLNLTNLRDCLRNQEYCKGLIKSTRIGEKNTSAYLFDFKQLKNKLDIKIK